MSRGSISIYVKFITYIISDPGDGPRETPVTPIERNKQPGN